MFYVIEKFFTGVTALKPEYYNANVIEIRKGTNDIPRAFEQVVSIVGEYKTLNKARKGLKEIFGDVREYDPYGHDTQGRLYEELDDPDLIEVWQQGKYPKLEAFHFMDLWDNVVTQEIKPSTTEEDLKNLASILVEEAENSGYLVCEEEMLICLKDRLERIQPSDEE